MLLLTQVAVVLLAVNVLVLGWQVTGLRRRAGRLLSQVENLTQRITDAVDILDRASSKELDQPPVV